MQLEEGTYSKFRSYVSLSQNLYKFISSGGNWHSGPASQANSKTEMKKLSLKPIRNKPAFGTQSCDHTTNQKKGAPDNQQT